MVENAQERAEKLAPESTKRDPLQENIRKCLEEVHQKERDVQEDHVEDAEIQPIKENTLEVIQEHTLDAQKGITLHAKKITSISCF